MTGRSKTGGSATSGRGRTTLSWLVEACLLALVIAATAAIPRNAGAALEPRAAEADRQTLITSRNYTFCTKPPVPLSMHATELCPLASELQGCAALVEACNPTVPVETESEFWKTFARWVGRALPYFAWALLAVLACTVLYFVVRAVRAARDDAVLEKPAPTDDVTVLVDVPVEAQVTAAEALLRRASEARARGDYRAALFTYLAATLRALDDRGAVRVAPHRTNGEYVRGCLDVLARPSLRDLVREVDGVQFGGNEATAEAVSVAQSSAERIVRGNYGGLAGHDAARAYRLVSSTLLTLALVLSATACQGGGGESRDDPAGRDLLAELLAKQGAQVSALPGSLASLPMQGSGGPVVILDVDRVPLEDETRVHLVAWVKQGGALVLAGSPGTWPAEFSAKPTSTTSGASVTRIRIETRDPPPVSPGTLDDDDDDEAEGPADAKKHAVPLAAPTVWHATIAHGAAMTWPSDDRAPRTVARLDDDELYAALRAFGAGRVLGLANADLLSNLGLAIPGNAEALVAMLATLDRNEFAVARAEQGIAPPTNPLSGLLRIGFGPALVHAAAFIPLLFLAYGVRQAAPRAAPPPRRRAFAEHVEAVGALYARRRAATHALAVYAQHVDDRIRGRMGRGTGPAQFLAARGDASFGETEALYSRALAAKDDPKPRGDELVVIQRLAALYKKAMDRG